MKWSRFYQLAVFPGYTYLMDEDPLKDLVLSWNSKDLHLNEDSFFCCHMLLVPKMFNFNWEGSILLCFIRKHAELNEGVRKCFDRWCPDSKNSLRCFRKEVFHQKTSRNRFISKIIKYILVYLDSFYIYEIDLWIKLNSKYS